MTKPVSELEDEGPLGSAFAMADIFLIRRGFIKPHLLAVYININNCNNGVNGADNVCIIFPQPKTLILAVGWRKDK